MSNMNYHVSMTVKLSGTAEMVVKKMKHNSTYIEGYVAGLIECSPGSEAKVLDIHAEVEPE